MKDVTKPHDSFIRTANRANNMQRTHRNLFTHRLKKHMSGRADVRACAYTHTHPDPEQVSLQRHAAEDGDFILE